MWLLIHVLGLLKKQDLILPMLQVTQLTKESPDIQSFLVVYLNIPTSLRDNLDILTSVA